MFFWRVSPHLSHPSLLFQKKHMFLPEKNTTRRPSKKKKKKTTSPTPNFRRHAFTISCARCDKRSKMTSSRHCILASIFFGCSNFPRGGSVPQKIYLPETNSQFTPENQWLEDEFAFWDGPLICRSELLVSGSVLKFFIRDIGKTPKW